ncbi:hypothetical protein HYC85_002439 [Camellia sinensis]|uniref:Uncharacterized protein n=1 Tax=Camellia sinensis TaxID=4442 RepID=A0A7J7I896_CAMSI|nr:hypothetical protein HYC85_002439 [Camellia sinensis]
MPAIDLLQSCNWFVECRLITVELVIYVVTLSCNIYFKFKILCKPHDPASLAPSVPVHCKSAPS